MSTGADMGVFGAIFRSLCNRSIDFYPRLGTEKIASVPSGTIVKELNAATKPWDLIDPSDANLDKAIELARASLNEVKLQTEYQDQKATRSLTVTTFLTALAGAFFASFASDYPLRTVSLISGGWSQLPIALTYAAFLLFVLSALAGALVTFHATRTKFKYPDKATVESQAGPTRSYLFYREMIGVSPRGWANSFVTVTEEGEETRAALNVDLKIQYLKNYVSEAYLVATKTADKLRYLQPAQSLLAWSLRFLLAYILFFAFVTTFLDPTRPGKDSCGVAVTLSMARTVGNSVAGSANATPCEGGNR